MNPKPSCVLSAGRAARKRSSSDAGKQKKRRCSGGVASLGQQTSPPSLLCTRVHASQYERGSACSAPDGPPPSPVGRGGPRMQNSRSSPQLAATSASEATSAASFASAAISCTRASRSRAESGARGESGARDSRGMKRGERKPERGAAPSARAASLPFRSSSSAPASPASSPAGRVACGAKAGTLDRADAAVPRSKCSAEACGSSASPLRAPDPGLFSRCNRSVDIRGIVDPVPVPLLTAPASDEAVRALCNASSLNAGGRSGMVGDTVPSAFSLKPPRRLKKPLGDCSGSSGDSLPDSEPTSLRDGLRPDRSLSMKNAI